MSKFGIPLSSMDSIIYQYGSLREKFMEMENVLGDAEILADLTSLIDYYPVLGRFCIEQGSKNIANGDVVDPDTPNISDETQAAIETHDNDPASAFERSLDDGKTTVAIEILDNFYLENEVQLVNDSLITAIDTGNEQFVRYVRESKYPVTYSTIMEALSRNGGDRSKVEGFLTH